MSYKDLRGWLDEAEKMGELKHIEGAHWDKEIGALCELTGENGGPALLFDKIPGYPEGFRVLGNPFITINRTALTFGVPANQGPVETLEAWRQRLKDFKPVPPVEVKDAPIKENIMTGDDVDLFKLPTPIWHELDGGRYLGTGCCVITRDPETGWTNLGTYRCRVFDKDLMSIGVNPGKHATMMMKHYHSQGKPFPLAVSVGQDPVLFLAAGHPISSLGASEYDLAGYLKGAPVEVTPGPYTKLPIPAGAEIVIEGEIPPPPEMEMRHDGPFGEWRRIYNSAPHPLMKVKSISYRNNPIILGCPTFKLGIPFSFAVPVLAGEIWNVMEYAGVPDVKGVWFSLGYIWPSMLVISIKQQYIGHARQAALAALSAKACTIGAQYVVVVDEDIDVTDEIQVLWAIINRADLSSFTVIEGMRTIAGSPMIAKEDWANGILVAGRVIIDACYPYGDIENKPITSNYSEAYAAQIKKKFAQVFQDLQK